MHDVLRGQGITFQELGHQGHEAALDSLKAQGFTGEGAASSELGHRGIEAALAILEEEGFTRKEALREIGLRRCRGALASLEAQGFTGEGAASSELARRGGEACSAIYRKSGNCAYPGCTFAISSGEFCGKHNPPKPEKSDKCRVCERVLRVNEKKVVGGVCNPCYQKPEATAARKKATAEKKTARETCSTPGCNGVNDRGRNKCYTCLYPNKPR